MPRQAPLPPEFASLDSKISYIQKQTTNEYSSNCPNCGGYPHRNGEWPDRFRMFLDGKARGWCRKCEYMWFPDMNDPDWRPDAEEIAKRAAEQEAALQRQIEKAQQLLGEMREARKWLEYHNSMNDQARAIWHLRGVPRFFQDWWKLGYSECTCWGSPSITIPIWGHDWDVKNIKHRLLRPTNGRYRQETSGIPASAFVCDPDSSDGPLFIAEGEIKAMVTFATLDTDKMQVVGVPSKTPSKDILKTFDDYDPVYICLDPDASDEAINMANRLGSARCKIVYLPDKIDDLILMQALDKARLIQIIQGAN